jgi:hypothetical protein
MVVRRWFRVRPVAEFAAVAGKPVDAPAAPAAVENEGDEFVLGCV